jgi:DNA-nicking Smr family endonuclease
VKDFGEILSQWENGASVEKPRGKPPPQKRLNPLEAWLQENEPPDKDSEAAAEISPGERRRRLRAKKPDAVIDLHGLTRDEAWNDLERFFSLAQDRGLEKVLIIHGKGNHSRGEAVLKKTVDDFLDRCPVAGERRQSNGGALTVILK